MNVISFPERNPLFVRKGLFIFQNSLFVLTPLSVTLLKQFLMHLFLSKTHLFLCFLNNDSFALVVFFKNLFLNRLRVYIAFLNSLSIKGASFLRKVFFFNGACLFTASCNFFCQEMAIFIGVFGINKESVIT